MHESPPLLLSGIGSGVADDHLANAAGILDLLAITVLRPSSTSMRRMFIAGIDRK